MNTQSDYKNQVKSALYFIPNIKQRLENSLHNARVIAAKAIL